MWRTNSLEFMHPQHGVFYVTLYRDGKTASALRVLKDHVDVIVSSTTQGVTVQEAKEACERRIRELDLLIELARCRKGK
jgi:Zn-dependent M16 (insulinase) family peptidase